MNNEDWNRRYEEWWEQEYADIVALNSMFLGNELGLPVVQAPEKTVTLADIDEGWRKRLLFVMHRRPDAVATR